MLLHIQFMQIFAFLICINIVQGLFKKEKLIHDLVNYVKHDINVYQSVILTAESSEKLESITKDLISEITSSVPAKVINYKNLTPNRVLELVKRDNVNQLRTTTLFIAIQSIEYYHFNSQASDLIKILSYLSGTSTSAKILADILSKEKLPSYGGLFQRMWSKDFLDFTILEIVKKLETNRSLLTHRLDLISVHQFNPFTKIYTKKEYTTNTVIFPNKLLNLNDFKIKVSSINYPPTLFVDRNNSNPIKITGPDAEVTKAISEVMNFKITEVAAEKDDWGHMDKDPNKTTHVFSKLVNKKIEFSTNIGQLVTETKLIQFSRIINYYCYLPVVPIIKTKMCKMCKCVKSHCNFKDINSIIKLIPDLMQTFHFKRY